MNFNYPNPVKIALVILHADSSRGGAERYTLDLAGSLVLRGHAVSILASSFQAGATAGARVQLRATGVTRTGTYRVFLDALDAHLDAHRYDIVHAMLPVRRCDVYHPHAGIAAEAVAAGHLNKRDRVRQKLAWLGNRFNTRRNRFASVERQLLNASNPPVVLCLSKLIQKVVERHYPTLAKDKLVPLFNGIDLTRFDPSQNHESRQLIRAQYHLADASVVGLMLAQDFERKGLRQAIEALAAADKRLVLFVGGKPDATGYRRLAHSLDVADRVIFVGPVQTPAAFYQAADFFVLPTRYDPCSLVVLEALAMGLPVISTIYNGACEIMQDGVQGRVLSAPDDVAGLASAMTLMTNIEKRSAMSNACLLLRSTLSLDTHLQRLEAAYTLSKRLQSLAQ